MNSLRTDETSSESTINRYDTCTTNILKQLQTKSSEALLVEIVKEFNDASSMWKPTHGYKLYKDWRADKLADIDFEVFTDVLRANADISDETLLSSNGYEAPEKVFFGGSSIEMNCKSELNETSTDQQCSDSESENIINEDNDNKINDKVMLKRENCEEEEDSNTFQKSTEQPPNKRMKLDNENAQHELSNQRQEVHTYDLSTRQHVEENRQGYDNSQPCSEQLSVFSTQTSEERFQNSNLSTMQSVTTQQNDSSSSFAESQLLTNEQYIETVVNSHCGTLNEELVQSPNPSNEQFLESHQELKPSIEELSANQGNVYSSTLINKQFLDNLSDGFSAGQTSSNQKLFNLGLPMDQLSATLCSTNERIPQNQLYSYGCSIEDVLLNKPQDFSSGSLNQQLSSEYLNERIYGSSIEQQPLNQQNFHSSGFSNERKDIYTNFPFNPNPLNQLINDSTNQQQRNLVQNTENQITENPCNYFFNSAQIQETDTATKVTYNNPNSIWTPNKQPQILTATRLMHSFPVYPYLDISPDQLLQITQAMLDGSNYNHPHGLNYIPQDYSQTKQPKPTVIDRFTSTTTNYSQMPINTVDPIQTIVDSTTHVKTRSFKKFENFQVSILKDLYTKSKYISTAQSKKVADELGLSQRQVSNWFARKRYVERKNDEKMEKDKTPEVDAQQWS